MPTAIVNIVVCIGVAFGLALDVAEASSECDSLMGSTDRLYKWVFSLCSVRCSPVSALDSRAQQQAHR